MATPPGIRGFNPIWFEVDLQAHAFDDNFWLYVLENTIPYIPAKIYSDPDLMIVLSNPIRFLANGTLPVDIFFDPTKVYRLEFRQNLGLLPPSQNDPLIYEVNNYVPGTGGGSITTVATTTENQISNPQFSLISFSSPFTTTTAGTYEIAPGWFLDLAGSGSATITQVPLNDLNINKSNAPYALHLVLSGWNLNSVFLRQRFFQNGMLWAGKIVSSTVTARTGVGFQSLTANLVYSNGVSTNVLSVPIVNGTLTEYTGHGTMPTPSTNPDVPPAAFLDYSLALSSNNDIFLTSFQLIVEDLPVEQSFTQDSINRQIDHTFHNYKDSILLMPKNTILTGWDFPLNPFQFKTTSVTDTTSKCQYIADQTIIYTTGAAAAVATGKSSVGAGVRQNLTIQANATASNQFALIQYVDASTIAAYWSAIVSSLVKSRIFTIYGSQVGIKMRLIWRTSTPPTISNTEPITSWAGPGTDPVFAAGWTAIIPQNDPVYILSNGFDPNQSGNALIAYPFENMILPTQTNAAQTLGIVIYTTNNMSNNISSTRDSIVFDSASLVPNRFAIDVNPQTYDEVLNRCQFYYEKSYSQNILPGTVSGLGPLSAEQLAIQTGGGNNEFIPRSFSFQYKNIKRSSAPLIHLYGVNTGTIDNVTANLFNNGLSIVDADYPVTNYTATLAGSTGILFITNNVTPALVTAGPNDFPEGFITYHYTSDARLGLVA